MQVTGIRQAAALERPLWELFLRPFGDESDAWLAAREVAARGDEFIVRACRVADAPELGTFSLQFRCAVWSVWCAICAMHSIPEGTIYYGNWMELGEVG